VEARHSAPRAGAPAPELIPVPASVFDDDFFQSSDHDKTGEEGVFERRSEASHFSAPVRVQQQENVRVVMAEPGDAVVRGASFSDTPATPSESDELDIPAFLRRGN
jgi:cell division protein FtsZ